MCCASSPSATFSYTVSQGNSAKLWNTIAIPEAQPAMGSPRNARSPELGSSRPAIRRSSVDLPDPERPKRPTICPAFNVRLTCSSTSSSPPSGLRKDLQTFSTASNCAVTSSGAVFMRAPARSAQSVFAFGVIIQRPPERTIDGDHEQAHGRDAQNDAMKVAGGGGLGDIGANAVSLDLDITPAGELRDDGRVPGAARGGDRASHIERQHT